MATVMFLSFRTDRSGQTAQTHIRLPLRVYTVCNFLCIFWIGKAIFNFYGDYSKFSGVQNFSIFTIHTKVVNKSFTVVLAALWWAKLGLVPVAPVLYQLSQCWDNEIEWSIMSCVEGHDSSWRLHLIVRAQSSLNQPGLKDYSNIVTIFGSWLRKVILKQMRTIKILKIRTPEKFAAIILKFEQSGLTVVQCIKKKQMEWQTL